MHIYIVIGKTANDHFKSLVWFAEKQYDHLHLKRTQSIELASKNMKCFLSIHTCVIQIKRDNFFMRKKQRPMQSYHEAH